MANEGPEKSFPTVCGDPQCRCGRIMSSLIDSRSPFFFADNNFTRKMGPRLPAKFVQQHGHEMAMEAKLEAAGMTSAVELVIGQSGKDDSVRMGAGWESFMINAKFYSEDLLFFTLQGQSRFAIVPLRGHNRRKADAEPEPPQKKVKYSERLLSDVLEGGTSSHLRVKSAAEQQKPGQTSKPPVRSHPLPPTLGSGEGAASKEPVPVLDLMTDSKPANDPGQQHVTRLSSHDAFESYMPLMESSPSCSEDTEMEEPFGKFQDFKADSKPANDPGQQHKTQVSIRALLKSYTPLLDSSHSGSEETETEEPYGEFEEDRSDAVHKSP